MNDFIRDFIVRLTPEWQNLLCPSCGGENLHHFDVTVFDRAEDAEHTRRTHVGEVVAVTTVPSAGCDNPSMRRDGLAVRFYCENCDQLSELTLAQHKGVTEVAWRYAGERAGTPLP